MSNLTSLEDTNLSNAPETNGNEQSTIVKDILPILQALGLAIIAGFVCNYLQIPVGWLVGPILVGISLAFAKGTPRPLPKAFLTIGKAIIGVYSASRFSPETLVLAKNYAIPLLLCISVTAMLSILNGFLLWRLGKIDRFTSFLGTIPGGASNIVAISEDLGANPVSVAILQYTRMILVALSAPSLANWLARINGVEAPNGLTSMPVTPSELIVMGPLWSNLLFLVGCCTLGTLLGRWLRLPASAFLGSFLLGVIVSWQFPHQFEVPHPAFDLALLFVGVSVGLRFSWEMVKDLWQVVLLEVGLIIMLMLACVGIGYEFHLITHLDTMTALLGFVPGAIEAMVATATQLGGDTGTVVALQVTRQFLILLVISVLNTFIASSKQEDNPG